jgi:hypothetical protein
LVSHCSFPSHLDANESILLSDLLGLENLGPEEAQELLLVVGFEDGDAADWIG